MTIKELRLQMMKSKKEDVNRSKVLQAILSSSLLLAKEDGNREANANDIIQAAKKEVKMTQQAKDAGAPFLECTFEVCSEFLPKMLSDEELENVINNYINDNERCNMGSIMKELKTNYVDLYDGKKASTLVRNLLKN